MTGRKHEEVEEKKNEDEQEKKGFLKLLPTLLSIFLPLIAYAVLISRVAFFRNETSLTLTLDAEDFSLDIQEATKQDINNYILLYWYDNMFIVPRGLFMAALLNIVLLPKYVKQFLFFTTIPGHPICDWIENTAAIMALLSPVKSEDGTVDEYWINQYSIWSKVKWSLLAINVVAVIIGFSFSLKKRFC